MEVEDCEDPVIICPADQTVECDGAGSTAELAVWLAMAGSSDDCEGNPEISSQVFNNISACGGGEVIVYEFVATDNFGNTSVCTASFEIEDTTSPSIDVAPTDLILECEAGSELNTAFTAWLNTQGGAVASDILSLIHI